MNTSICERRKEEWCFEQLWAKEGRMKKEEEEMRNTWEEENCERETKWSRSRSSFSFHFQLGIFVLCYGVGLK